MNRKQLRSYLIIIMVVIFSLSCSFLGGTAQPQPKGNVQIVNEHVRGEDAYPGGKNLPDTREYGICFVSYPIPAPAGLVKPTFDTLLAKDGDTTTWPLPAGTYTIQEWQFDSEINQDPLYSPEFRTLVRPVETLVIQGDETIQFGSVRTHEPPGDFAEGSLANSNCAGMSQSGGTGDQSTDTPEASSGGGSQGSNVWVLKLVQPDVGKTEVQFSYPGLSCSGGGVVSSTDSNATIQTSGTCQISGALEANEVTQHTWSKPPEQLNPGDEVTGQLTASQTGLCGWQDSLTQATCANSVTTSIAVWQGDGGPVNNTDFPYQNLLYQSGYDGSARASNHPNSDFKWTVPDGSSGGKTLLVSFLAHASEGEVYTDFWYEWQE
jgi:hypothetical protein